MKACGIYIIAGPSGVYVGSSIDITRRLRKHTNALLGGYHHNEHLQRAFDKYGSKAFIAEVLELCDEDCLLDREQYWLDLYDEITTLYNLNLLTTPGNHVAGHKRTPETKRVMSEARGGSEIVLFSGERFPSIREFAKAIGYYDAAGVIRQLRKGLTVDEIARVKRGKRQFKIELSNGLKYRTLLDFAHALGYYDSAGVNHLLNKGWTYQKIYDYKNSQ